MWKLSRWSIFGISFIGLRNTQLNYNKIVRFYFWVCLCSCFQKRSVFELGDWGRRPSSHVWVGTIPSHWTTRKKRWRKRTVVHALSWNSHLLFLPSIRAPSFQTFILTCDFKNSPQIWGLRGEAETKLLTGFPEPQLLDSWSKLH